MTALLLDTHALLWSLTGSARLGRESRRLIAAARAGEALYLAVASYVEIQHLSDIGRIDLGLSLREWRQHVLAAKIRERPMDAEVVVRAMEIAPSHPDFMDRLILATALHAHARLCTSDGALLDWSGKLPRQDARR